MRGIANKTKSNFVTCRFVHVRWSRGQWRVNYERWKFVICRLPSPLAFGWIAKWKWLPLGYRFRPIQCSYWCPCIFEYARIVFRLISRPFRRRVRLTQSCISNERPSYCPWYFTARWPTRPKQACPWRRSTTMNYWTCVVPKTKWSCCSVRSACNACTTYIDD